MAWDEKKRADELVHGPDATRTVGRWPRLLMEREVAEDGALVMAVETRETAQWPGFVRELFGELYGLGTKPLEPEAKRAGSEWIDVVLDQAAQLPEWQELRIRSEGDPWRCALGTHKAVNALEGALDEALDQLDDDDPQELQEQAQEARGQADLVEQAAQAADDDPSATEDEVAQASMAAVDAEDEAAHLEEARDQALESAKAAAEQLAAGDGVELRKALRAAAEQAHGEIDEIEAALAGLGHGHGAGALTAVNAPTEQVAKALRDNPELRRIAAIAGRIRLSAKREQNTKCDHGREEICDIETGRDVQRLLPSELVMLADPDLELLLLRKLSEGQALQYRMRGTERAEKGPIVLMVDGSASMSGARHEWAAGVALAFMEVAAMQRRSFALVHFGSTICKHDVIENPRGLSLPKLIEMVCYFANSGTNIQDCVDWVKDTLIPDTGCLKGADLLLVTDGESGDFSANVEALRAEHGAATFGIAIETHWRECNREPLADYHRVTDAQIREGTEDIGGALAL